MTRDQTPAMSVVLTGRDGYGMLRPIITCLAEQTIAHRIEVIAVIPMAEEPGLPDEVTAAFHAFKPVVVGPIANRGAGAARGVAQATAPVIAFSENHCFPDPDWAEKTLPHFDDPGVSGVAPVVENGNPEWGLSWACYATGYANYVTDDVKDVDGMPNHNTAYRASEFKKRANRLETLLRYEGEFQAEIREGGGRFVMTPEARTKHLNEGTWSLAVGLNYVNGNMYGAKQSARKTWPERILRAVAFPLAAVPIYRNNMARLASVDGRNHMNLELRLGLIAMSLAHAWGEARAYLGDQPKEFPFLDDEVYMLTERLGRHTLSDERLAGFVSLAEE